MATTISVSKQTLCPSYIDGQWVQSRSERIIERRNPANLDDLVGYVPRSTREEMRRAIEAATRSLPAWRDTPAPRRG